MKKRSQISIFTILALVVIIIGAIVLYMLNRTPGADLTVPTGTTREMIDSGVDQCLENILKTQLELARTQGGYLDLPDKKAYYQESIYVTSYDRDFPGSFNLPNKDEIASALALKLNYELPRCLPFIDVALDRNGGAANVYVKALDINATDDGFVVSYSYEAVVDNRSETVSKIKYYESYIPYFIARANNITLEYVQLTSDPLYNKKFCEDFYAKYGVKPEYDASYIRTLNEQTDLNVIADTDQFIINMTQKTVTFAFAIKPILINPDDVC